MDLLPHQKDGVAWMLKRENSKISGGILCDEMGLGKTIQTIATMLENTKTTLIVVPKSIVSQWVAEIEKFAPSLTVCVYNGTHRKFTPSDVCVCPYSVVVDLVENKWERVVLDEGHEIRNQKSLVHKTCMNLKANTKWILTGTPVFNRMKDFVSLCKFIGIEKRKVQAFFDDIKAEYILRRVKSEIIDIIPYDYENVELTMSEKERELYERAYDDLAEGDILEGILRCRQVCAWPQLYYDGIFKKFGGELQKWKGLTTKFKWVLHAIKKHPDEKSLVFTQFKGESEALKLRIEHFLKREVYILDGQTENRELVINSFKKSKDDGAVFIIQIKSGGVGLNLQEATRVYIMQPAWNPATELQAISRSHRNNQKKKVYVKKLVYTGPNIVETELVDLQNIKSVLCSKVIREEFIIPRTKTISNFLVRIGKNLYELSSNEETGN